MEEEVVAGRKRRMKGPTGTNKKEMPKRARNPPKKMSVYEPDPGSPRDDRDGLFVFLTFEDGYTAKNFNVCDILNKDDEPIACLRDLKPGEQVLARWSDSKFYNATVDFIGTADKTVDAKKPTKKDMKKKDAAAQRFYNLPSPPQAGQSISAQDHPNTVEHNVIQPPTAWQVYQPPPTESSLPVQPQHQLVTVWPQYHLPVSQSSPHTHQYYQRPPIQSLHQHASTLSPIPHRSSLLQYPKHHQPHTALPTPLDLTQEQPVLADLDQQRQPPAPSVTAKESFLKMLYSPNTHQKPAVLGEQSQTSTSEYETSSSSSADTFIIERDPIPECGEPCFSSPESTEDRSWKPCRACKAEVEILVEEKAKLQDVLCGISGEHLEALKTFLDKVEQIQPQAGVWAPKNRSGKQELYPESGLFLSSTRLAAIHAEAKDCLRLFHLLFDEFFTAEECRNAVAFGKHGKVPDGKTVLDKFKALKTAVIKPLLKKTNLDASGISNYRPISNLPFLGKIIERVVFQQMHAFMMQNNLFNAFQSGFPPHHSTETVLIKVLNDIHLNNDASKTSVLVLLDLSAAFDTVDHDILLDRLEKWVGFTGTVLHWFKSYLQDRDYFVSIGEHVSERKKMMCGVPQGSILGPLLFNIYMLPLAQIMEHHSISYHTYADDTQLYISVSSHDCSPLLSLSERIHQINEWMCQNYLQLNADKTEVIVIGPKNERSKISAHLNAMSLTTTDKARNLGVIIDSDLNFNNHLKLMTKSAYYHLKNITRIKGCLSKEDMEKLVHAFIFSRLDYCNGVFTGLNKKSIRQLQLIQNAAARVLTNTRKMDHITPVLRSLHWLPVSQRIDFKILLLVYKALNGVGPKYILDLLHMKYPDLLGHQGQVYCVFPE
ncbi:uncharacterized protein LOC143333136 [Chaetodon auriga]|uniref:uncharacterized protein LOC143333136 n=1 Tax=Chaetodon auriga TaxID=39042 RepID=UPI00403304C6